MTIKNWTAKNFDAANSMIPALVAVPPTHGDIGFLVYLTGGSPDVSLWRRGYFDGAHQFTNLRELEISCKYADSYLMKRADHYVIIKRNGLFDQQAA